MEAFTFDSIKNLYATTVYSAPFPQKTGTSFTLVSPTGRPTVPFNVVVYPAHEAPNASNAEIVRIEAVEEKEGRLQCTTIKRHAETGGVEREIKVGDRVSANITAKLLIELGEALETLANGNPLVSGTTYCSPTGNDAFDGGSFFTPKRTLQAAVEALPTTGEEYPDKSLVRFGTVMMGNALGTEAESAFEVESALEREETVAFFPKLLVEGKKQKGSPYVSVTGMTPWATGTTYAKGAEAEGEDGNAYVSRTASNTGNNPVTDATHWSRYLTSTGMTPWNSTTTYGAGVEVEGSNARTYISRNVEHNKDINPVEDVARAFWEPLRNIKHHACRADVGCLLMNPIMPKGTLEATEITEYWKGKINATTGAKEVELSGGTWHYTIAHSTGSKKSVEELCYVVRPAVRAGTGVRFKGQGPVAGPHGRKMEHAGTLIKDTGSGVTFWCAGGTPSAPYEGRLQFSDFSLHAAVRPTHGETGEGVYKQSSAIWGFIGNNNFGCLMERIEVKYYTGWGAYIGNNMGSEFKVADSLFHECGNIASKIGPGKESLLTGGLYSAGGTPIQTGINSNFLNCYGTGAWCGGWHSLGCLYNHSKPTYNAAKAQTKYSGVNGLFNVGGTKEAAPSSIIGGWMEGGNINSFSGGYTVYISVHLQGIGAKEKEGGGGEEEPEEWEPSVEYEVGEVVTEEEEGEEYIKINPGGKGVSPVSDEVSRIFWWPLESEWEKLRTKYPVGVIVTWKGKGSEELTRRYVCIKEVTASKIEPGTPEGEAYWQEETLGAEYGLEGSFKADNCHFQHHLRACINELHGKPLITKQCQTHKSKGGEKDVFIQRNNGEPNILYAAAFGEIRLNGKEETSSEVLGSGTYSTPPFNVFTAKLTERENKTTKEKEHVYVNGSHDVLLFINIAYEAGGTVERKQGPEKEPPVYEKTLIYEKSVAEKCPMEIYLHTGEVVWLKFNEKASIVGGEFYVQPV